MSNKKSGQINYGLEYCIKTTLPIFTRSRVTFVLLFSFLMSVEKLTEFVTQQQWRNTKDYTGVSDHQMHVQLMTIQRQDSPVVKVLLGTFNVLAEVHMWWQTGVRTDDKPLPSWYKLSDQPGLENTPLANPNNTGRRREAIVRMIEEFFGHDKSYPAVLCLQECSREIVDEVRARIPGLDIIEQFYEVNSRLVTLCQAVGSFGGTIHDASAIITPIEPNNFDRIYIANCHLDFATAKNEAFFDNLKRLFRFDQPILVIGDYNIPAMPISDKAKNEGSTKTISEMINRHLVGKHHYRYDIACHIDGFTNWNCRMNCVDPDANADHMDNILLLHDGSCDVTFTPLSTPDPGDWWKDPSQ